MQSEGPHLSQVSGIIIFTHLIGKQTNIILKIIEWDNYLTADLLGQHLMPELMFNQIEVAITIDCIDYHSVTTPRNFLCLYYVCPFAYLGNVPRLIESISTTTFYSKAGDK